MTRQNGKIHPLVCIGFAEAMSAPEVLWSLVDAGFEVVAFTRKGRASALRHSRHVTVEEITSPERDSRGAVADLQTLLHRRRDRQGVLMPLDDSAVWLCNQVTLDSRWRLAGPSGTATDVALDKTVQVELAKAAGFRVPHTIVARSMKDISQHKLECPLVLRPALAVMPQPDRLGKGRNWICSTEAELERALASWVGAWPMLIQPFISGVGEGVFGLATPKGVRAWSSHRRVRMMNPHGSGSSACISQRVPIDVKDRVERFILKSKWSGLFMVELLRDREGTPWFVEFNGRAWGSLALARRRGMEYPAWAVNLALNNSSDIPADPSEANGDLICRNLGRELVHLLFVLKGPKARNMEWPSFWRTAVDVLRIGRKQSFYNWRKDDWRVFVSDGWYTVKDQLFKARN